MAFPRAANGSLIAADGKTVGSALIGQPFADPKYFWGRPSATSPQPYNAARRRARTWGRAIRRSPTPSRSAIKALREADPGNAARGARRPRDRVGQRPRSAHQLAAAEYQVARVAKARSMKAEAVRALVARNTEGRTFGLLGEPRVNVVKLNLALDRARGK